MNSRNGVSCWVLAAGLAVSLGAAPALAQNALGGGRALDRNLRQGSGGVNETGRNVDALIRLNNAVVTGNAAGTRSFRGNVGYLGTDDFRAAQGADDIFSFQRQTFNTDVLNAGIRGTDALRYQMSLVTGGELPQVMGGVDLGVTGAAGANPLTVNRSFATPGAVSLRSTSDFLASRSTRPQLLGYGQNVQGETFAVSASPLMGVKQVPLVAVDPAITPDAAGISGLTGLESTARGVTSPLSIDTRIAAQRTDNRLSPASRSYQDLLADLNAAMLANEALEAEGGPTPAPGTTPDVPGIAPADPLTAPTSTDPFAAVTRPAWMTTLEDFSKVLSGELETPGVTRTLESMRQRREAGEGELNYAELHLEILGEIDPRMVEALRRLRTMDPRPLVIKGEVTDAYTDAMEAGTQLIGEGRYFDAEDRFVRALAVRPGDPMARAGRICAQLSAGLLLSAGQNLRDLFTTSPEMMPVRLSRELSPRPERVDQVVSMVRENLGKSGVLGRDAALLLSFIGYQTQNEAMLAEGLEALRRVLPDADAPEASLYAVLIEVWSGGSGAESGSPIDEGK